MIGETLHDLTDRELKEENSRMSYGSLPIV